MSVKEHANYSEIASSFDIGRRLPDEAIMQWIRLIRRLGALKGFIMFGFGMRHRAVRNSA